EPAVGGPAVDVAFHEGFVARGAGGGEADLGGGAYVRLVAPAGGQVELQLDLPGGGAQEFGARFLLPLGDVEPVDEHRLGGVGAAPPGAPRDDLAVAQGHALPFGAVHGGAVCFGGAQRVGQG